MSSAYDKLSDEFQDVAKPTETMLQQLENIAQRMGRLAWIQHRQKTVAFTSSADFYINPKHESEDVEDIIEQDPRDTYETIFASYCATRIPPEEVGDVFRTNFTITAVYEEPLESIEQVAEGYRSEVKNSIATAYEDEITDEDDGDGAEDENDDEYATTLEVSSDTDDTEDMEASDDTSTVDTDDEFEPIIRLKHRHTYNIQPNPFRFTYEQSFDYDIGKQVVIDGPYFDSEENRIKREVHYDTATPLADENLVIDRRDPNYQSLGDQAIFNDEKLFSIVNGNLTELKIAANSSDEHARRVLGLLGILAPVLFEK